MWCIPETSRIIRRVPANAAPIHLSALLLSLAFARSASADEFYVDAVHGNNSNDGRSPQRVWRTLEFAVPLLNGVSAHTVHLLPGMHTV
jgi:hypothetical protein